MNIPKHAEKLKKFLDDEFSKNVPVLVLPDKSLVYKNYKIKQNKHGDWELKSATMHDLIGIFKAKTSAVLAAKFYQNNNFNRYNEIKELDRRYSNNSIDATIFKYRLNTTKDTEKKDLYMWRLEIATERAKECKSKITQMFKSNF